MDRRDDHGVDDVAPPQTAEAVAVTPDADEAPEPAAETPEELHRRIQRALGGTSSAGLIPPESRKRTTKRQRRDRSRYS